MRVHALALEGACRAAVCQWHTCLRDCLVGLTNQVLPGSEESVAKHKLFYDMWCSPGRMLLLTSHVPSLS